MANQDLVDHSPHDAAPAPPLANASNLILIDNYDSFTWNVYQYLKVEGASVRVFRNDKITLSELVALEPTQLVISPGPGHPATDSGVSNEAIRHFAGKIPILGVCMGQQCMISAFGGEVMFAGEILHGKTSPLGHDAKGLYAGLAQDLPVTRYHSLAGSHLSLPSCFEVSSWSFNGSSSSSKIIMGVRHKEFVIEGVQFHPESILTGGGRTMIKNFLSMSGGSWNRSDTISNGVQKQTAENGAATNSLSNVPKANILESIFAHRRLLVSEQKSVPSQRPEDLKMLFEMDLAPPLVSFVDRLRKSPFPLSLMAEIKRASPSKGDISLSATAASQARTYALAGASVISVLTEPKWFKGSLDDMKAVRQALESMPNRPAVLRKDFIFDEYQILEARLAGADTVLLIVKMLDHQTLQRLYAYSVSLGMEPLVEVNNEDEMKDALLLNAKAIGVNNRNLTSFDVDLGTTSRLISMTPKDTILCALSGISKSDDVEAYKKNGVGAVLVGEALMRASNVNEFVSDLLGGISTQHQLSKTHHLLSVKICGTRSLAAAECAVGSGAKMIGVILVDGRKRRISTEEARKISAFLQNVNQQYMEELPFQNSRQDLCATDYFSYSASELFAKRKRVLLVGVFQNQPLRFILDQQKELSLDVVQLHGSEPLEWARLIPVPVIKAFKPGDPGISTRGYHALPLLDSASGGSGTKLELKAVIELLEKDQNLRIILAGGLKPDNVESVLSELGHFRRRVVGVDVSSGVETNGVQDQTLIRSFIEAAKRSHS